MKSLKQMITESFQVNEAEWIEKDFKVKFKDLEDLKNIGFKLKYIVDTIIKDAKLKGFKSVDTKKHSYTIFGSGNIKQVDVPIEIKGNNNSIVVKANWNLSKDNDVTFTILSQEPEFEEYMDILVSELKKVDLEKIIKEKSKVLY